MAGALLILMTGMSLTPETQVSAAAVRPPADNDIAESATILVKFQNGVAAAEKSDVHRQNGGRVTSVIPGIDVQVVTVEAGHEPEKAQAYAKNPNVLYAEPDHLAQAIGSVSDPQYSKQWGLPIVQAPIAGDVTKGSRAITIAILDTGIDSKHTDLASEVIASVNFSSSPSANDIYGHGTHVAGIAGASTNNSERVASLGYNSTLMNVKVLDNDGSGSYSAVAAGMVWAADNGASVINMSLGGSQASSTLEAAVNYAWSKGVVIVAASGNNGWTWKYPMYPAYYNNVIAVAATDEFDNLTPFSVRGDWVDLAAPGTNIYSTKVNNKYGIMTRTSMATPHVAGLAGLVFTPGVRFQQEWRAQ